MTSDDRGGPASGGWAPGGSGTITIAALLGGRLGEWTDGAAIEALGDGLLEQVRQTEASTLWIDLGDPDAATVSRVAELLGLHPLIAEDIVEGNQRPKLEATDGLIHVVVFALEYTDEVRTHEVDFVLGDRFILSAHPADWDPRAAAHFRSGIAQVMGPGPDHVLWALLDAIVDGYFPFADRLEDAIDTLQDDVVERTDQDTLTRLFGLKRDLIDVRRAVTPVREVLNQLTNRELRLVDANEVIYFRDIYDHVIRLTDELDTDRELVAATLDVYLSTVNNNLSAIMKRLTGATVILAGIGAIAGIFGMSEAGAAFGGGEAIGFWIVAIVTITISLIAAFLLRRIGWI
ncbi:MAG TPA: magnesium transporter CorA family protein [Candidatus Limnocylindrales bacterium]|nr:magnesium transporter CorA family protein [Candidatus Limnocylindrales bacterium]